MFEKIVAIEPIRVPVHWEKEISRLAKQIVFYRDLPESNGEIIRRIGDADCVLVSHSTPVDAQVLAGCPNIRYIGMCCSLYSAQSANVDIVEAEKRGIVVKGVRRYGDEGVPEFVISELVRLLHGFGGVFWKDDGPRDITGLKAGVLGLGDTGFPVARALKFFGADVAYYSRTRKPQAEEEEGFVYLPLEELLPKCDFVCTCLNRNVILLKEKEFALFGDGKILMNISIGPGHDVPALAKWLQRPGNFFLCDFPSGGDPSGELYKLPNVFCAGQSSGMTLQARERLGQKAVENMNAFLAGK